jgi:hypothetical protein
MGRVLLDQWLELWKQRNDDRHGRDQENQDNLRRHIVISQLTELYSYKSKVCPSEHHLFYPSVEEHLANHHLSTLEDWITTYKGAIVASTQQATQLGIHQNRRITDYPAFNPVGLPRQQASLPVGLLPR